ncbi:MULTISPECIES: hypothetical protein [unclassified Micromonospora]|uniref:hypothetical protein n=1 Tax=unclassified Micromonospora TaxID=2617518 RepID=UPI003A871E75
MTRTKRSWGSDRTAADAAYAAAFDRLFVQGRDAVLSGTHYRDTPPVDGGRWGMSVVFIPDPDSVSRLAAVTAEVMGFAGPGHWPTGAPEAVHFTVRAVEDHRRDLAAGDPLAGRSAAALGRAATACRPVRFRLGGVTLTPSGVMVCAFPLDGAADEFADRLGVELGSDGWFEDSYHRDIWYATLVHFTDEVRDGQGLVDWVARRRNLRLGEATIDRADLLRFQHNGRQPVRVGLDHARLGAASVAAPISDHR